MTVHEIKQAIMELSPAELAGFRQWFEEIATIIQDKQIERDAESEKLIALHPTIEERLKKLQGSLKGKGILKALEEERCKG